MAGTPTPRRRHPLRWVLLGVLLLLVVLTLDAAWAGSRAVDSLKAARDSLQLGGDRLVAGDLAGADAAFDAGGAQARSASRSLGQPAIGLLAYAPWISKDVDAARRGARATADAAAGGTAYVGAAQAAGWNGKDIPGFSPGGHFDAAAIARAAPGLQRAADLLTAAQRELAPVVPSTLIKPLQQPMTDAKAEVDQRAHQAQIAAALVGVLPAILGVDGERTYLLVTLSPSDPRAVGGYPGVYGVLQADGTRVKLTDLAATNTIPQVHGVPAPADVLRTYGDYGIAQAFWDTTYAPDFPTAARLMSAIWTAGGGAKVDGVIAGDPSLMAGLLSVVGPVSTPVWPETITSANVQRIVGADVYKTTSGATSDAWELGIGEALWGAVLTRPWPMQAMSAAISSAAEGRHLMVWSPDPGVETTLQILGVGGAATFPSNGSPLVTINGYTNNRAGYFATTRVRVAHIDLRTVTTTVTITNSAPSAPPSILLGMTRGDTAGKPLGTFGAEVTLYLPPGATPVKDIVDGQPSDPFEGRLFGRRTITEVPLVAPGSSSTLVFRYRLPANRSIARS